MTKSNPLFIDSTKMTGDSIGTLFELSRIALYVDEILKVVITNHLGETSCVPMTQNEELNYQARVWLRHQKSFSYQYVVEKNRLRILESAPKSARAQYTIIDQWRPVLVEPGTPAIEPEVPSLLATSGIQDHARSVAGLIEKFRF